MVASDIDRLVSDTTNFFHRSTDWSPDGGYFILDTHCTRAKEQLRRKALDFHLDEDGDQRRNLGSANQMQKSTYSMPHNSDSISNVEGDFDNLDVVNHE